MLLLSPEKSPDDYEIPKEFCNKFLSSNLNKSSSNRKYKNLRESFIFCKEYDFLSNIVDYNAFKIDLSWLYEIFSQHESQLLEKFPLDIVCKYILHLSAKDEELNGEDYTTTGAMAAEENHHSAETVIDLLDLDPEMTTKMMHYFINEIDCDNDEASEDNAMTDAASLESSTCSSHHPKNFSNYKGRKAALLVITKLLGCTTVSDAIPEISSSINNVEKTFTIFLNAASLELNIEILNAYLKFIVDNIDKIKKVDFKVVKLLHAIFVKQMYVIGVLMNDPNYENNVKDLIVTLMDKLTKIKLKYSKTARLKNEMNVLFEQLLLTLELIAIDDHEEDDDEDGDEDSNQTSKPTTIDMKETQTLNMELVKLVLEKKKSVEINNINQEYCDFDQSLCLAIYSAIYNHINVFNDAIFNIYSNFQANIGRRLDILIPNWENNEEIGNLPVFNDLKMCIEEKIVEAQSSQETRELDDIKTESQDDMESSQSSSTTRKRPISKISSPVTVESSDEEEAIKILKIKHQESIQNTAKVNSATIDLTKKLIFDIDDFDIETFLPEKRFKSDDEDDSSDEEQQDQPLTMDSMDVDPTTEEPSTEENVKQEKQWIPLNQSLNDSSLNRTIFTENSAQFSDSKNFLAKLSKNLEKNKIDYKDYSDKECLEIFGHIINVSGSACESEIKQENDLNEINKLKIVDHYVKLLHQATNNKLSIIKTLNTYYEQNTDQISPELAACYYLTISSEPLGQSIENETNKANLPYSKTLSIIISSKSEIISNTDNTFSDIILAYCNKKIWRNDWLQSTSSQQISENTTEISQLHPSINNLISRQVHAEHLLLRYAKYYKPIFLRNFYLFSRLALEKSKALDFADFKNRNNLSFWLRTLNILEAIGIDNLLTFVYKEFFEIVEGWLYMCENYCTVARKQCRVLTFTILNLLVQVFTTTCNPDPTYSSKILILICKHSNIWKALRQNFSQSPILEILVSISEEIVPYYILTNNTVITDQKISNCINRDFSKEFLKSQNCFKILENFRQKLTKLRLSSKRYVKEAAAGGIKMEVSQNLSILEKILGCKTAKIRFSGSESTNYNSLDFTTPDEYYEIFQIGKPQKVKTSTNNTNLDKDEAQNYEDDTPPQVLWQPNDIKVVESFITFCKCDKKAFLMNKSLLENFLINISKYPIPDLQLQKIFLNLLLTFIKTNHFTTKSENFPGYILKIILNILSESKYDKATLNLYLDFLPFILVLGSRNESELGEFTFDSMSIDLVQTRSRCDGLLSQLKLFPVHHMV